MKFRNFFQELKNLSINNDNKKKFQAEWKESIFNDLEFILPLDKLSPDDDLSLFALYKLLQRIYAERGDEGFKDIVIVWAYLIKKQEQERIKLEKIN